MVGGTKTPGWSVGSSVPPGSACANTSPEVQGAKAAVVSPKAPTTTASQLLLFVPARPCVSRLESIHLKFSCFILFTLKYSFLPMLEGLSEN